MNISLDIKDISNEIKFKIKIPRPNNILEIESSSVESSEEELMCRSSSAESSEEESMDESSLNDRINCLKRNFDTLEIEDSDKVVKNKDDMDTLITDTKKLCINPYKKIKIGWANPSLNKPCIDNIKKVSLIKTPYYSVIKYYFYNKPLECMHWEDHYIKNIDTNFDKHWDIFLFMFLIDNVKETNNSIDIKDCILIEINKNLTLLFKNTPKKDLLKYENNKNYKLIKNLRFVTHCKNQKNIYNNLNSWILHLILNEEMMELEDKEILLDKNFILKVRNLYESLYIYHTK